ncbi:polysaccharide pyruvyl transferase family protein [Klebsiella aerogenes]|uniref:polysaccharide pyruvyl transferase family protein n=2 Tax=Klebsiella aerogenes TaxID=548 RepID=UPI0035CF8791
MFDFKKLIKKNERKKVFWWEPRDGTHNAGDHLAKVIVEQMLALKDKKIIDKKTDKNKLLSIGSVMHFAKDGDTIWGTGINGKIDESHLKFQNLNVRAVRGPRTREFLMGRGITVPEVYGDPGLLLPMFFSKECLLSFESPKNEFIVIPHMNENFNDYKKYENHICTPKQGALCFTREIVNSKFVISGSLHGIIIAEAYGIPAVFLNNNSGESRFKYDDYYLGTGRGSYPVVSTVEEAFDSEIAKPIELAKITKKLMASFPYDLW